MEMNRTVVEILGTLWRGRYGITWTDEYYIYFISLEFCPMVRFKRNFPCLSGWLIVSVLREVVTKWKYLMIHCVISGHVPYCVTFVPIPLWTTQNIAVGGFIYEIWWWEYVQQNFDYILPTQESKWSMIRWVLILTMHEISASMRNFFLRSIEWVDHKRHFSPDR